MTNRESRTLYRDPKAGKVAGVCAGIAEYFNLETWLVRVVAVSIFLLGGSGVILIIYIALWMILDIKPQSPQSGSDFGDIGIKKKVWQAGEPAKQALRDLNAQFNSLEQRLRKMEHHVTSDQYDLKRQINNL
ncbi:envelope stress response membrane protein PspC [Shewanella submarina]|uniref:Envelope stress response membrane protein PspC n=1 Tax=Shewanella submarina TaxID=2016376 RepID=A0ABV7G8W5_9GAMM|nr:envelope stress response membrane protein PspC [Shewanella submarina]MCL1036687.1 envelope stress response membrane protein PspC [Shewanella submarina]